MRFAFHLAWACLAPLAAGAQAPALPNTLARARAIFASADRDGDARLSLAELRGRQLAITELEFRAEDADRDGAWSGDEFLVRFRALLSREGVRPAPDLEAEVVRVLALRRACTIEEVRPRGGPAAGRLGDAPEPAPGAALDLLELDARLQRAIGDLQARAAGRGAVRQDFERVRALWNERVTRVRMLGEPPGSADLSERFVRALGVLEAKARAGSVPRSEFAELDAVWRGRPVQAGTAGKPGAAGREPSIEARFESALATVEAKVFARAAKPADWAALRDLAGERARRAVQGDRPNPPPAGDPRVASAAADLRAALARLEALASSGSIARADFQRIRADLALRARAETAPRADETRR